MNISSASSFLLLCAALLASAGSACAAEGHIGFSGAVVEPTCMVDKPGAEVDAQKGAESSRQTCGATSSDPGRAYTRTVTLLDEAIAGRDPLLSYFTRNAISAHSGGAQPRLVVRTYE
jgi:type 1 fimbria pilin